MHSIRKSKLINSLLFIIKSCIGVNLTFCQFSIYFSSSSIPRIDTAICLLFWFPFQFFAFHSKFIYVQNIIKKSANTFNNQSLIEWNNNEKTKKKIEFLSLIKTHWKIQMEIKGSDQLIMVSTFHNNERFFSC